ncbi:MAG: hotdog domain-containing protein [Cyanobacteriota bacterium]
MRRCAGFGHVFTGISLRIDYMTPACAGCILTA